MGLCPSMTNAFTTPVSESIMDDRSQLSPFHVEESVLTNAIPPFQGYATSKAPIQGTYPWFKEPLQGHCSSVAPQGISRGPVVTASHFKPGWTILSLNQGEQLQPTVQIKLTAYFYMAHELRMASTFLDHWKKSKGEWYFVTCKNHMKLKFQRPE